VKPVATGVGSGADGGSLMARMKRGKRIEDPLELERLTLALCEAEFRQRWGVAWRDRADQAVAGWAEADYNNRELETRARVIYDEVRRKLLRVIDSADIETLLKGQPDGAGGAATWSLRALLGLQHKMLPAAQLPHAGMDRKDLRPALVARYGVASNPVLGAVAKPRELAVISLLARIGPGDPSLPAGEQWVAATAEGKTVADVISNEEKRIRRLLGAETKEKVKSETG